MCSAKLEEVVEDVVCPYRTRGYRGGEKDSD
jgi:hypothetical protein